MTNQHETVPKDPKPQSPGWRLWVASAAKLGLSPVGPGTCGALLGVGWHAMTACFAEPYARVILAVGLGITVAFHLYLTPWAQAYFRCHDPKNFVLDEVAGYLVVPLLWGGVPFWPNCLYAFFLFRIYDIIKLPIARQIDRKFHGAWGVLLDDIVSGGYAVLTMLLVAWLGPRMGIPLSLLPR